MKKLITTILAVLAALTFMSCGNDEFQQGTFFLNYNEFLEAKNSWVEPENYSFRYRVQNGVASYTRYEVVIKDSIPELTRLIPHPIEYPDDVWTDDGLVFLRMEDIFNYIQENYEYLKKTNKKDRYSIYVEYGEYEGRKYIKYYSAHYSYDMDVPHKPDEWGDSKGVNILKIEFN